MQKLLILQNDLKLLTSSCGLMQTSFKDYGTEAFLLHGADRPEMFSSFPTGEYIQLILKNDNNKVTRVLRVNFIL